ncbi:hypothetical protein V1L52_03790 [Treponema sp. HNW]|uniref:hypothetical protein n=1 Tax=Treponema sp. HNW TaxID=3116654 RepID=UPI003D0D471F
MRSGQKVVISLLGSVLFFAAFTFASFFGLFSAVEARFYRPSLVAGIQSGLHDVSDALDLYLATLKNRFYTDFAENAHVKQSFSFEQSAQDIRGREDAAGNLFASSPALTGIRIIDSDGKKIHYSTLLSDVLKKSDTLISYRLYKDVAELPYERIVSEEGETGKLIFDPERGHILFSFPFYDSYSAYRGTIVFYTAASDFIRELIRLNAASITDSFMFTGTEDTPLFVLSFPPAGREILRDVLIGRAREKNILPAEKIVETDDSHDRLLFSHLSASGIYVARIYEEDLFVLSDTLRLVLLISVFITSFLILFLALNIKQDDMLIIRDKIRRFQFAVIHDYLKRKEEVDWQAVCADMKRRRQEINIGIKQSLGKKGRRHVHEVDYLLDKSWDEIIAVLQNQNISAEKNKAQPALVQLQALMDALVSRPELAAALRSSPALRDVSTEVQGPAVQRVPPVSAETAVRGESAEEVEELAELEDAEAVEVLEEAERADSAEEIEELAELEDAEAVEVLEEAERAESAEEVEEVAELGDAEAVEVLEEAERAESAEEVEEVAELEDAEALEVLEETERAEPVESAEKIEIIERENAKALEEDDLFYEELKIGEGRQKEEKAVQSLSSDIDDIFSGVEIGLPDFSVLDDIPVSKEKTAISESDIDAVLADIEMGMPDFSALDEFTVSSQDGQIEIEEPKLIEAEEIHLIANTPFSFTLGKYASIPETVSTFNEPILERDGLFVISAEAGSEIKESTLDTDFQTLVKSVLK